MIWRSILEIFLPSGLFMAATQSPRTLTLTSLNLPSLRLPRIRSKGLPIWNPSTRNSTESKGFWIGINKTRNSRQTNIRTHKLFKCRRVRAPKKRKRMIRSYQKRRRTNKVTRSFAQLSLNKKKTSKIKKKFLKPQLQFRVQKRCLAIAKRQSA